ncbi:uncharacterized protein LOC115978266 isoform X2 [Quercus lobata]|uniref:uncharacterized protein LOC115978266 isoform X2 n=1 Tax=Quercus lobata TaxID=97700 RepID=UPI00124476B0|nr:uncharacterized protein LOC115978266 isoform X2 [Quercus lobata]
MKLSSSNGCQLLMQRQNLKALMEELLGLSHNSKELGDFYSRVNRFPMCRLGHLRNHPLLLTPKERFLLPVIAIILLNYGRTASTWRTSYNQQFKPHKVDIKKKVQGDREYWRIFTHREMSRYQPTPANQVVFSQNAKSHLNDEYQCKTLEEVEEDLNRFFPNMLPDLNAFLMDQGIDAFHKENDKYGEDVLSHLHPILKRCMFKNEICSYVIPEASQSQDLSSDQTNFKEKIQYLLKYVPSSYQLKEPLANPKDIRCGSSIAGFLFQLASHLGQLAGKRPK